MDCYKKVEWPSEPLTSDDVVENNIWAVFKQFRGDFEGVFILYFWWGFVQNEDPGQIRWKPQMLSFSASASVENHILFAFERFQGDFEGASLCFLLLVRFFTKRRPWPNVLKTSNIIVPLFCFRLESCLIYFQAISRRFWRGLRASFCAHPGNFNIHLQIPVRFWPKYTLYLFTFSLN